MTSRIVPYLLFLAISSTLLLPISGYANRETIRFNGRVIKTGMSKGKALHLAGQPDWKARYTIVDCNGIGFPDGWNSWPLDRQRQFIDFERLVEYDRYLYRSTTVNIEEWLFNRGSSRFMRIFRFENELLVAIEELDYGFNEPPIALSPDWNTIENGDTTYEVNARFGSPSSTDHYGEQDIVLSQHRDFLRLKRAHVTWWYYNSGPTDLFRRIKFVNGRVVEIVSEGYGH